MLPGLLESFSFAITTLLASVLLLLLGKASASTFTGILLIVRTIRIRAGRHNHEDADGDP